MEIDLQRRNMKRSNDAIIDDEELNHITKKYLPDHDLEMQRIESLSLSSSLTTSALVDQKRQCSGSKNISAKKVDLLCDPDEKSDVTSEQKELVKYYLDVWKRTVISLDYDEIIVNRRYQVLTNLLLTKDILQLLIRHPFLQCVISRIIQLDETDQLTNETLLSEITTQKYKVPFIKLLSKLNYNPHKDGMCYGIAWTAMISCTRRGGLAHMKRMCYLSNNHLNLDLICAQAAKQCDPYQLYPYFDTVVFSMGGCYDYQKKPFGCFTSQSIEYPNILLDNTIDTEFASISVKDRFVALASANDITMWLKALKDNNPEKAFSVMMHNYQHAVSIGFDGNQWLAVNHDDHLYTNQLSDAVSVIFEPKMMCIELQKICCLFALVATKHSVLITENQQLKQLLKTENLNKNHLRDMLSLSLSYGVTCTINKLIKTILNKCILEEEFIELLLETNNIENPVLLMAMEKGWVECIQFFVKEVLESKLLENIKYKLLSNDRLFYVIKHVKKDIIQVFLNEVLISNSSNDIKYKILSEFYKSLKKQFCYNIVRTFLNTVLNSKESDFLKINLLSQKKYGESLFFIAIKTDNTKFVKIFVEEVLASNSSEYVKIALLTEIIENETVLSIALNNDLMGFVLFFVKAVLTSDSHEHLKVNLLTIKKALSNTSSKKHSNFSKQLFVDEILKSGLSENNVKFLINQV